LGYYAEEIPVPTKVNWINSDDLVRTLLLSNLNLERKQDDVESYPLKKKVNQVAMIYPPSELIVPFTKLAIQYGIDVDDIDPRINFGTRAKSSATMAELIMKMVMAEAEAWER
jgi:hypothetical protein